MKLRKLILRLLFVLVIIGLVTLTGRLMLARLKAQGVRQGGPIPYTVILRETVHHPDVLPQWLRRSPGVFVQTDRPLGDSCTKVTRLIQSARCSSRRVSRWQSMN